MSHLNAETLARLVDEAPAALEAAHLAECEACSAELDAMRADVHALGKLGDIEPPAHAWDELHTRLATEGLLRGGQRRGMPALLRLAAALALFLTGTLAGFAWRGATLSPAVAVTDGARPDATTATASADASQDATGTSTTAETNQDATSSPASSPVYAGGEHATSTPTVPAARSPAQVASATRDMAGDRADVRPDTRATEEMNRAPAGEPRITGPLPRNTRFADLEYTPRNAQEAATLLRDAEGLYLDALAQYAQHAGATPDADDPFARLVALESIVLMTREALDRAPADPIINGYHMTAVAQREATLRQIAATSRSPWF